MAKRSDNPGGVQQSYSPEGGEVIQRNVKMVPELYELACAEAKREGITLSEVFTRAFAERVGRGDLWTIPKEKPGPRPGEPRKAKETAKAS